MYAVVQIGSRILTSECITALIVWACTPAGTPARLPTLAAATSATTDFLKSNIRQAPLMRLSICKNRAAAPTVAVSRPPLTSRFKVLARLRERLLEQFQHAFDGGL